MPLGARPGPSPQLRELKQTVRRLLALDDDTAVMVRQLTCAEPGCPPLETIIAVLPMNGPALRWTLRTTAEEITEDDLRTALLTPSSEGA
ncbi:hypothetical protein GTZ78_14410 [Streptomyces sp. SID8361]|uniref:hypothetical protein n=1 Tax=Streptomyces TaxID=1883 RepID=UPI00081E3BA7|nr:MULTISPECIES: hypothetical protein [unclassified Streptomyces]AUA17055.1 hypothetical protein CFP59_09248 [Streptomyces sp. M56]MYU11854.1 hypothetical protein [Streptomyces sp. SID8361]MYX55489.1 hypothetical protein [Streptomyces sp. SID8382]SCF85670.1 hypothetical protein GA0115260_103276 [Streptomyces sp. MnatMP-M27]